MVFCIALAMFWQTHMVGISTGPGSMDAQLDGLSAVWTAQNVPMSERLVTLVLSDAESSGEPLALARLPAAPARLMGWLRRTFLGDARAASDSGFAGHFSGDQSTVLWTQASFPSAEGEAMTRDIRAAIIKAHDAGAELDIVAQGFSAGPALKAVQSLDGTTRGGVKVGVNKLVTVGMNWPALNDADPYFKFGRPDNLREWAAIWTTNSDPVKSEIALFSAGENDAVYPAEELYPSWSPRMEDVAVVIKALIHDRASMHEQLARRTPDSLKPPPKLLTWKNHEGFSTKKEAPAAPASAPRSPDSLAMVTGGSGMAPSAANAAGAAASPHEKHAPAGGQGDSGRILLTRKKYFGYDLQGQDRNADTICMSEYPLNPPAGMGSSFCDLNPESGDPPLAAYPDEWAWTMDRRDPAVRTSCPPGFNPKNEEWYPNALGVIASRGKEMTSVCTAAYPVACCVRSAKN